MRAKPATDVNQTRAKARDKSATRLAILEAARRLAAEHGIETLTLASVAVEAGFARATVYGYFKSKEELLQSVVADDVDTLTAVVDRAAWPQSQPAESTQEDAPSDSGAMFEPSLSGETPQLAEETPQVEEQAPERSAVERFFADLSGVPMQPLSVPAEPLQDIPNTTLQVLDEHQMRLEHKAELDRILNKLTPSDSEQSEGSAAALARFDRRLRVVERTLADLQTQQERADRSTSTSADFLSESLRGLNQRLEEAERRQRESFAELRAGAREAARRLDLVEGKPAITLASFAPSQQPAAEPVHAEASPETVPETPTTPVQPAPTDEPVSVEASAAETSEPKTDADAKATYLDAARAAARVAVEQAEAAPKPKPWLYRIPRKYLMFTCAVMSVVTLVIGILVVQRATALAANAETIAAVASRATSHPAAAPKQLAVVTPLDELSALAANGNGKAQLLIGLKYLKGEDGPKKPEEAAQWIGRAAQRGEAMAQYWAGYVYQHGIGVSADPDEAMRWYEAAADQGNMKAMYDLGVGYAQGWAGARDVPEASRWFARAARLGFVDAQFNLAVLYERGQGVPQSLSDAYKWYAVAAKNGDTESKKRLDAIATQLDGDDLAAARRSADDFRPTPSVAEANTLPALDLKRT
ncbi:MAG TPA: TetR family transcriptional regulator [Rhizomicrobium sp.]